MAVAMAMFGAIYYVPLFVQGVLGASVTRSGAVLVPQSLSTITMSVITGLLITRTGRYKALVVAGLPLMGAGIVLLTRMNEATTLPTVVRNMAVLGLGMVMQTYTLIVQNAVDGPDMGVATATAQLFRSIGSTAGVAILGSVLAAAMAREIPRRVSGARMAGLVAESPRLRTLLARIGDGDVQEGTDRLMRLARALPDREAVSEGDVEAEIGVIFAGVSIDTSGKLRELARGERVRLTSDDVAALERLASALTAAALLDRRDGH